MGLQFPAVTADGIGVGLRFLGAALLWPLGLILGRRASVWRALVVLPLLPAVGMPVLASELIRDRLQQAATAERIERDVLAVSVLERLRAALGEEVEVASIRVLEGEGYRAHLHRAQLFLGTALGSVEQSRSTTDELVARLPHLPPLDSRLSHLADDLTAARRSVGLPTASSEQKFALLASVVEGYTRLTDEVNTVESSLAHQVASGAQGLSSRLLLTRTQALESIVAVVIAGEAQVRGFYQYLVVPAPLSGGLLAQLRADAMLYQIRSQDLPDQLTPGLARSWRTLLADPEVRRFSSIFEASLQTGTEPLKARERAQGDLIADPEIVGLARAGGHTLAALRSFLNQAIQEAVTTTHADSRRANLRAIEAVALVGVLLVVTLINLVAVGGTLRRRLQELAQGAQRLSAGHLDHVPVRGPRELAATSGALNDAVLSLRDVETRAEILAAGDLDSPTLAKPAPGPLGKAVHASVALVVSTARDHEELRRRLAHQAAHDPLTELANRAEIHAVLRAALTRARPADCPVSVLFLDLDRFKECNDRFGHAAGDHVLRTVAGYLKTQLHERDTAGRLGGDEFVLIIESLREESELVDLGTRIVRALGEPIGYEGHSIEIGASVGIARDDAGLVDADELIRQADAAVYRSKAAGGGTVEVYDPAGGGQLERLRDMEWAVVEGLRAHEFRLHYQPLVSLSGERLHGFEALLRWERPGLGLLPPEQFLPELDDAELIADIGHWVLGEASRQLARWSADAALGQLSVAVNISPRHLQQPRIVDDVRAALEHSGLDPRRLVIELAESPLLDDTFAVEHLHRLAALGVRIALDDFGTGHASISQLLQLPLDIIKLDPCLLDLLLPRQAEHKGSSPSTPARRTMSPLATRSLIETAQAFGLMVVAEGIECRERLHQLGDQGLGQGFLLAPPMPPDQARSWALRRESLSASGTRDE